MNNAPFIFTADKGTAEQLLECGFQLVSKNSSGYTFLNCKPNQNFNTENLPNGTFSYSNKLCI